MVAADLTVAATGPATQIIAVACNAACEESEKAFLFTYSPNNLTGAVSFCLRNFFGGGERSAAE